MKLIDSFICLDCDEITPAGRPCPACGSTSLYPVARWIPSKDKLGELIGKPENVHVGLLSRIDRMLAESEARRIQWRSTEQ